MQAWNVSVSTDSETSSNLLYIFSLLHLLYNQSRSQEIIMKSAFNLSICFYSDVLINAHI